MKRNIIMQIFWSIGKDFKTRLIISQSCVSLQETDINKIVQNALKVLKEIVGKYRIKKEYWY